MKIILFLYYEEKNENLFKVFIIKNIYETRFLIKHFVQHTGNFN